MKNNSNYVCREPKSIEELLEIFHLRYKIYTDSGLSNFLLPTTKQCELDIDWYDLNSLHFGLYEKEGNMQKLVGTMRMVGQTETKTANWIRNLSLSIPEVQLVIQNVPDKLIPMMNYMPFPDSIEAIYKKCIVQGKELLEISRFAIDNSHRALFLSRFMIETMIAVAQLKGNSMIFTCAPKHRMLYQAFHNWPLYLTPEFICKGIERTIIYWDMSLLPKHLHRKIKKAAENFIARKELHFSLENKSIGLRQNL